MPDNRYPLMINGAAVVSAPAEIDIANAEQLRMLLLEAGRRGRQVPPPPSPRVTREAGFQVSGDSQPSRHVFEGGGGPAAVGFGAAALPLCQVALPSSPGRILEPVEEDRSLPVHPGGPVVNGSRMLIRHSTPALMLLVSAARCIHGLTPSSG